MALSRTAKVLSKGRAELFKEGGSEPTSSASLRVFADCPAVALDRVDPPTEGRVAERKVVDRSRAARCRSKRSRPRCPCPLRMNPSGRLQRSGGGCEGCVRLSQDERASPASTVAHVNGAYGIEAASKTRRAERRVVDAEPHEPLSGIER